MTMKTFSRLVRKLSKLCCTCSSHLQCAIPCFEGLLPSPHDEHIATLLYMLGTWHGLAKMRMHTSTSVHMLDDAISVLGIRLRQFVAITCSAFVTHETDKEFEARSVAARKRALASGVSAAPPLTRKPRTLNIRTIKTHFLGDYPSGITYTGTTDSSSTQIVSKESLQPVQSLNELCVGRE